MLRKYARAIARKLARWLLRNDPDCGVCYLPLVAGIIKEKDRYKEEAELLQVSYDALLEEMEELL